MNHAQEILQTLTEHFATTANVKQIFGEPIETQGKTIVASGTGDVPRRVGMGRTQAGSYRRRNGWRRRRRGGACIAGGRAGSDS